MDATENPGEDARPSSVANPDRGRGSGRDKLLMLAATAARMATGLLTFIVLARFLGPESFGLIATAMAYTGILALLSDFGAPVYALRAAAADPGAAGRIVGDTLAAKAVLAVLLTMLAIPVAVAVLPRAWLPIYALIHVGSMAFSAGDLTLVIARARQRFDVEAKLAITGSLLMLLIVGGVTAWTADVRVAALAFAGTRLLYLVLTLAAVTRWLGPIGSLRRDLATLVATFRRSASYAVDSLLTSVSGQVDVLLFGAMLSAHDAGIYQGGSRLVQVIIPFAMVLSTIYLPRLVQSLDERAVFRARARWLVGEFVILALMGAIGFAFVAPLLALHVYGDAYAPLGALWAGFGIFVLFRLVASSFGILLVALGEITFRIGSSIVSMAAFAIATAVVLPRYGLPATGWLFAFSALPSLLILGSAAGVRGQDRLFTFSVILLALLGAAGIMAVSLVFDGRAGVLG